MTTSNQKFLKWFQEFYSHEFPNLPKDFKDKEIEKVLFNNQKYITKQEVIDFDACVMCGRCCEGQRCPDFDNETKKCTRHDNPINNLCISYPWTGEEMGIAPLTLNCHFMVSFFIDFFDRYFKEIEENAF